MLNTYTCTCTIPQLYITINIYYIVGIYIYDLCGFPFLLSFSPPSMPSSLAGHGAGAAAVAGAELRGGPGGARRPAGRRRPARGALQRRGGAAAAATATAAWRRAMDAM